MIKYDIFQTVRGWAGVVFNEKGLIRLALPGEDRETIQAELGIQANWQEVSGTRYAEEICRYFNGEKVNLDLPIDWSWCTPFQEKVLRFVKEIPYG
ncbi:MAG TPA: hypothetical protein VNU93_02850, partial [Verrucomicrobiae bacterium]|nr:hypothetical protein [Verrucomicrobiae bacterium]